LSAAPANELSIISDDADMTSDAVKQFEGVDKNIFVRVSADGPQNEESIPCHCRYNPDSDPRSRACGESSDCINRLVQMECNPLTCPCAGYCLNRRFQKRQYASVRVINAGRKGFGIQALEDLDTGRFVMEYMGEVVTTAEFRKRSRVYQAEGIQHHYFMSIGHNKVIDATRKGCIARFVNHSCGPNCVLQKWMVAGAIRMGIFVQRPIKRGEEITFDYKFERLAGTEPQPCYCGSPECKGVIGVAKERSSKTSSSSLPAAGATAAGSDEEALDDTIADIDDEIQDDTVTRHQRDDIRRRHAAVDDEDYGSDEDDDGSDNDGEPAWSNDALRGYKRIRRRNQKGLTSPEQVLKFVQIMHRSARQTRIIEILIGKLMETSDRRLLKSLIGLQGAGVLRSWLLDYENDDVMMIKILQCVAHMPFSTRNTIEESRIEETVKHLCSFSDENVANLAADLVERWSSLRHVFKIPKKSRKESVSNTPADSCRQSPARTCSTPPVVAPSNSNDNNDRPAGSESPGPLRWSHSASQSRMRYTSPGSHDASGYPSTQQVGAGRGAWGSGRAAGTRGASPSGGGSSNAGRSPGRAPPPYASGGPTSRARYASHLSRSRSPTSLSFRRTSSYSRFQRSSTGDYPPPAGRSLYNNTLGSGQQREFSSYAANSSSSSLSHHPRNSGANNNKNNNRTYHNYGRAGGDAGSGTGRADWNGTSLPAPMTRPDPPPLASGWRTAYSNDGLAYYYHETTKETRWEPPLAEAEPTRATSPMVAGSTKRDSSLSFGHARGGSAQPSRVASLPSSNMPAAAEAGDKRSSVAAASRQGRHYPSASASPASAATAAAASDDVKVNGAPVAKVDEIIERAWRLGMRHTHGAGSNSGIASALSASATQLVTPETDGEPSLSASAVASQPLANTNNGSSLGKRSSAGVLHAGSGAASASSTDVPATTSAAKREKLEKKATSELAAFVVRAMGKYKSQLNHDDFKHEAKKITKILMEKERKSSAFDPLKLVDLGQHKKSKIKQFVLDYMSRLVSKRSNATSPTADTSAVVRTPPAPSDHYNSAV
ncbi:hypothetical protein GGI02_004524, partial [Coemansia sp. RSA 2322]